MERYERLKGGLFGLIIGDALGVPYEFHSAVEIPPFHKIEMEPPKDFARTYQVRPGTWSDDSAQALCLLDSLLECGGFDLENFAGKLMAWLNNGLWAVDGQVFDCGIQTHASLSRFAAGYPAKECGFTRPDGKGNGALMRVLPVVLYNMGDDEELIQAAQEQCLITHGHICNQMCCALYCLWARRIIAGLEIRRAFEAAVAGLKEYYQDQEMEDYLFELEQLLRDGNFSGGGYVIDTMRSTMHLLFTYKDYESVVKEAIRLGNDTDTTAAVAGGLAGLYYGYSSIPTRWLSGLRDRDEVEKIFERVLMDENAGEGMEVI